MNDELRQLVWDRAAATCEYCRVPQQFDPLPFGVDHILPQYHHGPSVAENLCLACFQCILSKQSMSQAMIRRRGSLSSCTNHDVIFGTITSIPNAAG